MVRTTIGENTDFQLAMKRPWPVPTPGDRNGSHTSSPDGGPPEAGKYLLSQACHPLAMRILIGVTAGWIAFYAADQALFGARLVPALPQLAKSILNGFGVHL
jgi:hypothetical protein